MRDLKDTEVTRRLNEVYSHPEAAAESLKLAEEARRAMARFMTPEYWPPG